MKIESGQKYEVSNKYKKSFVETTFYFNEKSKESFTKEIGWRTGTINVIPDGENEVYMLQSALDDEEDLCITDFEEFEFVDSWDGCWEEYESENIDTDEMYELWQQEDNCDDYWDLADYICQNYGFEEVDMEAYFTNGINVELIEEEETTYE